MKALRLARTGTLDSLVYDEVPVPEPASDEVRVRIHAASLNPSDVKNVLGGFSSTTLPRTPGRDFAGVVVEGPEHLLGREVWGSGRELGFTRDGTHAEFVTLPARGVSCKPNNLSFAAAAGCGVPYLTALEALDRAGVRSGTSVLIIGFGSVARAALALAASRGARPVVAVRRERHLDTLTARGLPAIMLGERTHVAGAVRDHFPGGAEVVFDTTGYRLSAAISAIAVGGRIAVIAAPDDGFERIPLRELYRRGANIVGVNSLLTDTITCADTLDSLRVSFETGALPAPGEVVVRPLAAAIDTYREVSGGSTEKYVFDVAAG
ncbi:zinc-binding alcohol dehydrogenase family protein [Rhodococcus sp. NCIMB 12038]|uniref:quinone oxidoreductase family protein n=1 Tax=Rhodococcus sp. NCIMB 12038 TaxID=933800 RepID=UPI000B3D0D0B|nr:zinc-binding alcohol dehydrogenase family protein [Rhodococcus sp. NCIMB 12038]OUS93220.1 oxidoreductase [Rhodococcus sp. NCIMB 12038]